MCGIGEDWEDAGSEGGYDVREGLFGRCSYRFRGGFDEFAEEEVGLVAFWVGAVAQLRRESAEGGEGLAADAEGGAAKEGD